MSMEGEREKSRDQTEGSGQQQPLGQRNDSQTSQAGQGSEPPRSMGTRGEEFGQSSEEGETGLQGQSGTGQSDLGTQADTTLAGRAHQQDLGQGQPGSQSGGFVGSQDQDSGEYLQKSGNPESGFAEEGQGAPDQGDIERGIERSQNRESDIEGTPDDR
jgi:hypothetical protein